MKILYFTGTGNSLYVAKSFKGELLSIPQMMKEKRYEFSDDVVGLVFPCYMFDVPPIVKRFLRDAKIVSEYKFAVFTYGGDMMSAPHRMKKFLAKIGKPFDYIGSVDMADNYIPMFEQQDQIDNLPKKDVDGNIKRIIDDVNNRISFVPEPKFKDLLLAAMMRPFKGMIMGEKFSRRFIVNGECNKCGTCARVCPSGNVSVGTEVQFHDKCESCLSCIQLCPKVAIHLKKEKSAARFKNSEVTLNEIIEANEQSNEV